MFRGTTDLETRVLQVQGTRSPDELNELLRELEPFARKIAFRVCGKIITIHDDEYSIAMLALNEAITHYRPAKASFLSFAHTVIQRRLVDHFRQESRHQRGVSLYTTPSVREEEWIRPELVELSFENHQKHEVEQERRVDVKIFAEELARFGIRMEELVKKRPKHRDTRENLYQAARVIASDRRLLERFYSQKKADKDLAKALGMHRRTLNRHRNYLIALTIVIVQDLRTIKEYIGM
jgi:RNA polymerase sigma factor